MNYKIDTCRFEVIFFFECLSAFLVQYVFESKPKESQIPIVSYLVKLNVKLIKKLLKTHSETNEDMRLSLSYMDLVSLTKIFHLLDWNEDILANEMRNKLQKMISNL